MAPQSYTPQNKYLWKSNEIGVYMYVHIFFQFNDGNGVRLRYDPLSSEMVEGKMVLKILKPPRNKDSLGSLTGQSLSWVFNVSLFSIH